MVAPWLIIFIALSAFPLIYGLYLSFTNYYGFNIKDLSFMGMYNYNEVFTDGKSMPALARTFVYAILSVPINLIIALALAMILSGATKGAGFFRTAFYLPSIIPAITTIFIFKNLLYSTSNGLLSQMFKTIGLKAINWQLFHPLAALIIMGAWGAGSNLLLFLSALKGVSKELYESAEIDGANSWQMFWRITFPLITPVTFFNLIMGIIGAFQVYMQPIMLFGSQLLQAPSKAINLYIVQAFQTIFGTFNFAYGMAMLWVLFIVILVLSAIVFGTQKFWVFTDTSK
jgi:multiple sugar transport system permease protein